MNDSCPVNDPISNPERYPGDLQAGDDRRFQLVLAAVQGLIANTTGISPEVLATRAISYADAVLAKLQQPEPDDSGETEM